MEVNPTYTVVSKKGMTDDIMSLYFALNEYKCVLQYVRSGRIALQRVVRNIWTSFWKKGGVRMRSFKIKNK